MRALLMGLFLGLSALPRATVAEVPAYWYIGLNELPAGIHVHGELISALRYRDAHGQHIATFARVFDPDRGNGRLQVQLWSGRGGQGKLVRVINDAVTGCEFDMVADFIDEALSVTDLDGDGNAELTFAYLTACTSDVSPLTLKLIILEGRNKYSVRGTTLIDIGNGQHVGGDMEVDPALQSQPALEKHARAVWAQIATFNPWD